MHRRLLRRFSVGLALALLVAQWAVASYACPLVTAGAAAQAMAAMPGCDGSAMTMDPEQPQLCKAHCDGPAAAVHAQPDGEDGAMAALLHGAPALHAVPIPAPLSGLALRPGGPPPKPRSHFYTLRVLRQ